MESGQNPRRFEWNEIHAVQIAPLETTMTVAPADQDHRADLRERGTSSYDPLSRAHRLSLHLHSHASLYIEGGALLGFACQLLRQTL